MGESMTVETGNTDTTIKPNVFVGLDAPDRIVMRVGAALYIHGWVFSSDADVEAVFVECNGIRYAATYPIKRPALDVAKGAWINAASIFPQAPHDRDLNRDSDAPYDFGFVSSAIDFASAHDATIEIAVIAQVNGKELHLVTRHIEVLISDPARDYFSYGMPASFKHPINFQASRIASIDDQMPVFLIGKESSIEQVARALKERGVVASDPAAYKQMRATIETCYDAYSEYDFLYFNALKGQLNDYGFSKFDIYALINGIAAHFHEQALQIAGDRRFFALSGENDVDLIPLLKTIYPNAVFVHFEGNDQAAPKTEDHSSCEDDFTRKMRVLQNGNAPIHFRRVHLGEIDEDVSVFQAIDEILQLAESLTQNPTASQDVASDGVCSKAGLRDGRCDSYLQALPTLAKHKPIFILGAGRSGTSAMTGALKVSGIAGFHEGHVLPLINEMTRRLWELAVWHKPNDTMSADVRADAIRFVAKTCFDQTYGDIGTDIWLDKTADHLMIHCVPFLAAMFPNARFLLLTRHPIAVAESRRRKFGETPYFSMLEWKRCVIGWNERKHLLNTSSYMECDAKELRCKHLHQQISKFLQLDSSRSEQFSDYLATQSPEMTRQAPLQSLQDHYASLNDRRMFDFKALLLPLLETLEIHVEDTNWNEVTIAWVKRFLGELPAQLGYALHRPENMLTDIIANFAKLMEEQRRIMASNEDAIAVLQEKYAKQLANTNYWKEQYDYQFANTTKWKELYENNLQPKPEKTYRRWFNEILHRS